MRGSWSSTCAGPVNVRAIGAGRAFHKPPELWDNSGNMTAGAKLAAQWRMGGYDGTI